MKNFVHESSIVRKIWSKSDTIIFIFAGSSAEFALNKAVDWLYFTGKIPSDPLNRLFSTVSYAQKIVFADEESALRAIDTITAIHKGVEASRGYQIPDWAYRDVMYMLIDYSIIAYELLERKLEHHEKEEIFEVFGMVGKRMGLKDLPTTYESWVADRQLHLEQNLALSKFSHDLFQQYKKHLGLGRYLILLECQKLVVPTVVKKQLSFNKSAMAFPLLYLYKLTRLLGLSDFIKSIILPNEHKAQVKAMEVPVPQQNYSFA